LGCVHNPPARHALARSFRISVIRACFEFRASNFGAVVWPWVAGNARVRWYQSKSPGLGEEFLETFYRRAGELPGNPLLYARVYEDFRRQLLPRFPFALYFIIRQNEIVVFGLFHCARDPRRIISELRNRTITE